MENFISQFWTAFIPSSQTQFGKKSENVKIFTPKNLPQRVFWVKNVIFLWFSFCSHCWYLSSRHEHKCSLVSLQSSELSLFSQQIEIWDLREEVSRTEYKCSGLHLRLYFLTCLRLFIWNISPNFQKWACPIPLYKNRIEYIGKLRYKVPVCSKLHCLFALLLHLCLMKSVVHTLHLLHVDMLRSTGIANNANLTRTMLIADTGFLAYWKHSQIGCDVIPALSSEVNRTQLNCRQTGTEGLKATKRLTFLGGAVRGTDGFCCTEMPQHTSNQGALFTVQWGHQEDKCRNAWEKLKAAEKKSKKKD